MKMPVRRPPIFELPEIDPGIARRCWRFALIAALVILISYPVVTYLFAFARGFSGWPAFFALAALASQGFLLFVSPFLIRSQGRLAVVGCCVPVMVAIIYIFN